MVTALPLAERDAYFALRMSTAIREPTNLKESPRGTQYCHTLVMTSSELSRHVDTWIFQPCAGTGGDVNKPVAVRGATPPVRQWSQRDREHGLRVALLRRIVKDLVCQAVLFILLIHAFPRSPIRC